jgi:hypothetical protein
VDVVPGSNPGWDLLFVYRENVLFFTLQFGGIYSTQMIHHDDA